MALSLEDRKFIKSSLPYGAQKEIAELLGVSRISVNQYLKGSISSKRIEDAVIKRYETEKKRIIDIRNRIYE